MRKLLAAMVAALGLASAGVSAAPSFSLGGHTGPITIKFKNFESLTDGLNVGSENYGVLTITSVTDTIGNNLWTSGGANGFLTGVFNDIVINGVDDSNPANVRATASGGKMNIYLSSTQLNPFQGDAGYAAAGGGCAIGDLCYNTVSNTADGILFLSLDFAAGADAAGNTLVGNFDAATIPTSGDAFAYLDVTGGAYAGMFNTNGQTTGIGTQADFLLQNTFCPNGVANCEGGTPVGDWDLLSDDPVRGRVVPEPATVALVGLALLGLGALRRSRKV